MFLNSDPRLPTNYNQFIGVFGDIVADCLKFLMNCKYNNHRLEEYRGRNKRYQIFLAVGSLLGTLSVWRGNFGQQVWVFLGFIFFLSSGIKPLLKYDERIEVYSKLSASYHDLYYDLNRLWNEIKVTRMITPEILKAYDRAIDRSQIISRDDDKVPDHELLEKCKEGARQEKEVDKMWYPKDESEIRFFVQKGASQ